MSNAWKFGKSSIARAHFSKQYTQQWYTDARANYLDDRISVTCRCCNSDEAETILHILRCPSRNGVHTKHNEIFVRIMREIEAPNHLLHMFEAGIDLALINEDTHSSEEWNGNPNGSRIEIKMLDVLNDDTNPQQYKTAFQQQMKVGWEHLLMGKMASGWRQCWPDKTCWRSSITHTFMEWGRACWSYRNIVLYEEHKDKYKITRLQLKAKIQVWLGAPSTESLIPIQQNRWKRKLLKKAANSDIAF